MVTVYPIPYYFESHPNIADLVESSHEYGLTTFKKKAQNLYLFVPMAVSSFDPTTETDLLEDHWNHFNKLQDLCEKYEANGIMSTVSLLKRQSTIFLCFSSHFLSLCCFHMFYREICRQHNSSLPTLKVCCPF